MNKKYTFGFVLLLSLTILLTVSGAVLAANGFEIQRWVIAGGGGPAEGGDYVLNVSVGQAVVGGITNTPYELCAGFWCGVDGIDEEVSYTVYLPLSLTGD